MHTVFTRPFIELRKTGRISSGKMESVLEKKALFQSEVVEWRRSCVGLTIKKASIYLSNGAAKKDKREVGDVAGVVDEVHDPLRVVVHVRVASGGENGNAIVAHVALQPCCAVCDTRDVVERKVRE